jgi:hypothetical protein
MISLLHESVTQLGKNLKCRLKFPFLMKDFGAGAKQINGGKP